jgi:hypothetical protein
MSEYASANVPAESALSLGPPKLTARPVRTISGAFVNPVRWCFFGPAVHMIGQLGLLFLTGKWPPKHKNPNTVRGVDFYPWKDFLFALIRGARLFKNDNGYLPTLTNPSTFNEHIFVRKFFAPMPMPSLADKLAAREHVKKLVGEKFVPAVMWIGNDIKELFTTAPPAGRYVLKANNSSGSNLYLNLPEDLTTRRDEIGQWANAMLTSQYGYNWGEWHYATIAPTLFLEQFIDFNGIQTPDDYKFYCFRGKARLVEVDVDRLAEVRSALYAPDWTYIPVNYGETPVRRPRPRNLEEMICIAEAIAQEVDFVRVDLYSDADTRIVFGEITFAPGNAGLHFSDFRMDQWLGSHFDKSQPDDLPF